LRRALDEALAPLVCEFTIPDWIRIKEDIAVALLRLRVSGLEPTRPNPADELTSGIKNPDIYLNGATVKIYRRARDEVGPLDEQRRGH
jgi:hypothetical protein